MTKNEQERQFLAEAVRMGEKAKRDMIKATACAGTVVDFVAIRQMDMNIRVCKDELERSKC